MIFGIVFLIMIIAGIVMATIGVDKEIDLLYFLGIFNLFSGVFGIICFIFVNLDTIAKMMRIWGDIKMKEEIKEIELDHFNNINELKQNAET